MSFKDLSSIGKGHKKTKEATITVQLQRITVTYTGGFKVTIALGKFAPGVARSLDGLAIHVGGAPVISVPIAVSAFADDVVVTGRVVGQQDQAGREQESQAEARRGKARLWFRCHVQPPAMTSEPTGIMPLATGATMLG